MYRVVFYCTLWNNSCKACFWSKINTELLKLIFLLRATFRRFIRKEICNQKSYIYCKEFYVATQIIEQFSKWFLSISKIYNLRSNKNIWAFSLGVWKAFCWCTKMVNILLRDAKIKNMVHYLPNIKACTRYSKHIFHWTPWQSKILAQK